MSSTPPSQRRPPRRPHPRGGSSGSAGPRPATFRLTLEYDGSRLSGWQDQTNARTVMGELRAALADAGFEVLDLGGAGRTDAGVHALGQVAHLRLAKKTGAPQLMAALNSRLSGSIHVLAVEPAPPRFHARHDAVARSYLYQISRRRTAFAKKYVWWVKDPLDLGVMDQALALLPGRHDFQLFAEAPRKAAEKVSTLVEIEGVEMAEEGDLVVLRFVASHYLWRMVRRLVGTLVQVGSRKLSLKDFQELLAARPLPEAKGSPAQWTAPAAGLFLERVFYPEEMILDALRSVTAVRTAEPLVLPPEAQ